MLLKFIKRKLCRNKVPFGRRKYLEDSHYLAPGHYTEESYQKGNPSARLKLSHEDYGFDISETWDLDSAMVVILMERLRAFIDLAGTIIDLDYTAEMNEKDYDSNSSNNSAPTLSDRILNLILLCALYIEDDMTDPSEDWRSSLRTRIWTEWAEISPRVGW